MDTKRIKSIVILAIVLLLLEFMLLPINIMTSAFLFRAGHLEDGVIIHKVLDGPSKGILNEGEVIYQIDDRNILRFSDIPSYLDGLQPGDTVSVKTDVAEYVLTLSNKPSQKEKAYMGVEFTPNYKERNVPIIKEVLIKTLPTLLSACIMAILVYSVVFIGLGNVLLAFFGPILLITVFNVIRASRQGVNLVYPGFKVPVLVGVTLLLILFLLLFVVPSVWIKKDDNDCFKKILIVYFALLIFNSISKIYYAGFILIDALLLPISYTFLVLWSILLKRIFQKNLAV